MTNKFFPTVKLSAGTEALTTRRPRVKGLHNVFYTYSLQKGLKLSEDVPTNSAETINTNVDAHVCRASVNRFKC